MLQVLARLSVMILALSTRLTESVITSTTSDIVTDGTLTVCPGTTISLTCSYNNATAEITLWQVSGNISCNSLIGHNPVIEGECGPFTIDMVSDVSEPTRSSTAQTAATKGLDGAVVLCRDGGSGGDPEVGIVTIRVKDVLPPQMVAVNISKSSSFTVSWSPPSDSSGVGGYMFSVTGEGCGCVSKNVSADTTGVACSEWTAADQNCSFAVRTVSKDCAGFSSDPVTESVTLAVPPAPTNLSVSPMYYVNGSIQEFKMEFTGVNVPVIGAGISNDVSYTVMLGSLPFPGVTCSTTDHCTLRVTGSQLTTVDGLFTVSVVASNAVGSGPSVTFPAQVPADIISQKIVRVTVNVSALRVTCTLLSSYQETSSASCSIAYGTPPGCDKYEDSSQPVSIARPNDILMINLTHMPMGAEEFCYRVELLHNTTVLSVVGTFRSECDEELSCGRDNQLPQGGGCDTTCIIAVAVVVFGATLLLLIVCVIIALCLCRFRKRDSKSEGSKGNNSQDSEKKFPPVGSQGFELKEPPAAHLATYADPDDIISNPQLPPRKYEGAEESTSKGTELPQYESIEAVRSPKPQVAPDGKLELYTEVFDALPKGRSTKIKKKPTLREST